MITSLATTSDSPPHVLGVRDWFQVVRGDAVPNIAEVIQFHPVRDGADFQLVHHAMCTSRRSGAVDTDAGVSPAVGGALPQPAPVGVTHDERFHALAEVTVDDQHNIRGAVPSEACLVHPAVPVVSPHRLGALVDRTVRHNRKATS